MGDGAESEHPSPPHPSPPHRRVGLFGARRELRRSEDALLDLEQRLDAAIGTTNRLATQNAELRRLVGELRDPDLAALEARRDRLRVEVADLEGRVGAAETDLATARGAAGRVREDAERLARDIVERAERESAGFLAQSTRAAADAARRADEVRRSAVEQTASAERLLRDLRAVIVETEDTAMLQEVGIYEFRHRLADAVAYRERLEVVRAQAKDLVRQDGAVLAAQGWTVNGSATEGRRMIKDYTKLMLRAYNAEVDAAVRTMRPHRLEASVERLARAQQTIARLGRTMNIRISEGYHLARIEELELTADHLAQLEEEKERARAERERARDEAAAAKEVAREREKLMKEQAHWRALADRAEQGAVDESVAAEAAEALGRIDGALEDLSVRANPGVGTVYVISNVGAFGENVIKVGVTRRPNVHDRVRELGDASVPFAFDLHAAIFTQDAYGLEKQLHQALADRRVNRVNMRREFFYATPAEVREILATTDHARWVYEYRDDADAVEWRTSQTLMAASA